MESGLGAVCLPHDRILFRVWAPAFESLEVLVLDGGERRIPLQRDVKGYHSALIEGVPAGTRYYYLAPNGDRLPDPASRSQPAGVHGPSQAVSTDFQWQCASFRPAALNELVIYELHMGTFTDLGTFDAAIERLPYLSELGVTAVEVMPIAQFPGGRNWGYDGVFPFAAQNTYGGPAGFARFVDACHAHGLAVVLDVVYNHLGPEGNVFPRFAPYFNARYRTPWGDALNFDDAHSDEVRRFFIENARHWLFDLRIDALRLDAVHAILDTSAYPFLTELADTLHAEARERDRTIYLIAESDLDDPRMIRPRELGGHGLDGQWADGFHHALHTLLTGETRGYYADYGGIEQLGKCLRDGYVFTGQYSAFRQRRHGAPVPDARPEQFVVASQNHDQIGNRMRGDRSSALVKVDALKLAAVALLAAPFTPLLFMGEEFGEVAPFPYFVSHGDDQLVEAVRSGRAREFESFSWQGEPPDPQSEDTFRSAKLSWELGQRAPHDQLLALHRELLRLRRELRLGYTDRDALEVITFSDDKSLLVLRREHDPSAVALLLNFHETAVSLELPLPAGIWQTLLDTSGAPLAPVASTGLVRHKLAPWSGVLLIQEVKA